MFNFCFWRGWQFSQMNLPECMPTHPQSPRQQGLGALAPVLNLQRGPEIGPVTADFTHQECAPPPLPPRGGRPRCRLLQRPGRAAGEPRLGPSQHWWVGRRLHRLPGPWGQSSGRIPRSAAACAAQGAPAPGQGRGRGTSPRPDPQDRPRAREGAPFPWDFWIHFRPGEGREDSGRAGAPRVETGAAPVLPHPGATSSRSARTFNSSERWRVPECGWGGPSLGGGGRSRRKYGGGFLRPAETPLSWGGGNAEEGSRRPLSRTPPPQFCLDGCSREPAPQLPFSPSFSPRCLRLLLPPPAHPAPPRRAARVPCVMASRPPGPPRAALGGCRSLAHVRPGSSWRVPLATGCRGGPRSARPLCGPVSRPFCPSAGSTLPRAGGAVGQVSPPRMGGVAGAAPDVVVDAGLEDPGFWHSARHLLLVSLCSHGSPVRLAAPGRARLGCCCEFLLLSAWKCLPESGGAPAASFLTVLEDLILPQGLLAAALSRNLTPYVRVQRIFATRLFPSPTSLNFTKSLKYSKFILQYLLIHSELL